MKILVENSVWTNVGNAWFQTSLYYYLKALLPEHNVFMGEGSINLAFRINNKTQEHNALNIMDYQEADMHVFSGPILECFIREYKNAIIRLRQRGEKYCLISISGTGMDLQKRSEVGEFFKKFPPEFVATRDEETYLWLKEYTPNIYNGICTSFLVGKVIPLSTLKLDKPYFISSFYRELEPYYTLDCDDDCTIETLKLKHYPTMLYLPYDVSRHLNFLRKQQKEVGGKLIVRTIQNINTKYNHINFAMPNSFISFNPLSYLELVKSSEFTISDRVHACAISLALNKPARFLFKTSRAGIFDRLGFDYHSQHGIMYPNSDRIDEEIAKLSVEIKRYL